MIHYAVVVGGKVIGARSSKSHAVQVYTHAVVVVDLADGAPDLVVSYHGSQRHAGESAGSRQAAYVAKHHGGGSIRIVPVLVTRNRVGVGTLSTIAPQHPACDQLNAPIEKGGVQ